MTESGIVIGIDSGMALVRINRKAACQSCGMCGMTSGSPHADVRAQNSMGAKEGDVVTVRFFPRGGLISGALLFVLPLLLAGLGLFIGRMISEEASLALCLVMLVLSYAAAYAIDKRLRARPNTTLPVIIAVLPPLDTKGE